MPKLYQYLGISFYFWANEHLPVHIHITKGDREMIAKFEMEKGKLVNIVFERKRNKKILTPAELSAAKKLLEVKHQLIINRWMDYYIKNKDFKTVVITKRIK